MDGKLPLKDSTIMNKEPFFVFTYDGTFVEGAVMKNAPCTLPIVVGMMATLVECYVNNFPECNQIEAENELLLNFNKVVSKRHDYIDKVSQRIP